METPCLLSWCLRFPISQIVSRSSFPLLSCQNLLALVGFTTGPLVGKRWYSIVVSSHILFIRSDVAFFFTCPVAICVWSLQKRHLTPVNVFQLGYFQVSIYFYVYVCAYTCIFQPACDYVHWVNWYCISERVQDSRKGYHSPRNWS